MRYANGGEAANLLATPLDKLAEISLKGSDFCVILIRVTPDCFTAVVLILVSRIVPAMLQGGSWRRRHKDYRVRHIFCSGLHVFPFLL